MDSKDVKDTDLGLIVVQSKGKRDRVIIAGSGKVAFVATCGDGISSRLNISPDSWMLGDKEWADIVKAYVHWKRNQIPGLKFPHGRQKNGTQHPWRRKMDRTSSGNPE